MSNSKIRACYNRSSKIPTSFVDTNGVHYKFDECIACVNRALPDVCVACTNGEMFEPESEPVDFEEPIRLEDL